MEKYDLIVIGGGPGGYEAAIEAAKVYGNKVAIVEKDHLGGTCLNRGCIPTKTLLHTADALAHIQQHGQEMGILGAAEIACDMAALQGHKTAVVEQLVNGVGSLMKSNKIAVYKGTGQILDAHHVQVNGDEAEPVALETEHILIATGSVPAVPPIPGAELAGVVTSDEMLDQAEPLEELVIIGGGVIGMEFAELYSALGTKVTVVEALDRILANMDKELSRSLAMIAKKSKGIDIHTSAMVKEIKEEDGKLVVCYEEKEKLQTVTGDKVLLSVGRRANTAGLFAESAAGIAEKILTQRGLVAVDETYETQEPGIYAIGDVIGGIQLAHVATAEGRTAVAHMNGAESVIRMDIIPSCIYTSPEIAGVGLTEAEAKEQEIAVITKKYPMGANGRTLISMEERSFIKLVAEAETHRLLGAQMMCARATDMIAQFAQAIANDLKLEDMAKVIYPHPTYSEGIGELVR
ncbi:MAG: dihydrolipoyl dehydrogenase [Firmicutes bacterium]|nr:dihydrolipoyl dehydrogenase [Bacillota bacterium]